MKWSDLVDAMRQGKDVSTLREMADKMETKDRQKAHLFVDGQELKRLQLEIDSPDSNPEDVHRRIGDLMTRLKP